MSRKIDLGAISAYAIAVENGFEGTEAQWLASLKGNKGEKGNIGNTPVISVDAEVAQTTGTPTVEVNQSGTAENPILNFSFSGLKGDKGDKGDDGLDGFSARLPQVEYNPSDYLIVDDGTDAKKISVKDFVDNGTKDIWKVQGQLGAKNLLTYPYVGTNRAYDGIEFNESNGIVTINGSTSITSYYYFMQNAPLFKKGEYILSVPEKTPLNINTVIQVVKIPLIGNETAIANINGNKKSSRFEVTDEDIADTDSIFVRLVILANTQVDNLVIAPMIRHAEDIDDTWVLHTKTNRELTEKMIALENKTSLPMPFGSKDANTPYANNTFNAESFNYQSPNIPLINNTSGTITFQLDENNSMQFAIAGAFPYAYIRRKTSGVWGDWKRLVTEDDLATLSARITALENK